MTLEPTATLIAPQGAIIVLEDGSRLVVPQGAPIGIEVLLAESRDDAPVDPTVEALREAIARGEDPTAIQEAPAAGENAGSPGSSRSGFLDASGVGRDGRVERTSYEYEGGFTDPTYTDEDEDGLGLDPESMETDLALTVDAPALTSDTTPTIVGTTDAEDGSTVTLVITDSDGNEQTVTATVENGTYSVDAETPLSEGEYSVEATVTDPAGNTATSNDVGEIDLSAPALTVDAPALTSDTTPTIVGTTDAEDGSTVTLLITDSDGNEQTVTATVENGTYSVDAETPLSEGEYSVEATVTDPAGNTATSNDVGEIDASAPSLTVDAPALTSDTTPTIVGTTDAEDGSTVTLVITDSEGNEQTVTATVENGTYSVDAETPLSEGEYSVEATVTDPAGNTATSNDVGEIDASAPSLTVDAPALTSDTTPTIVGTTDAEDGSTVTLVITDSEGNEQTVTATVENGTYSVDAETPLSEGEYSVEATVTDLAGNTATSNDVGEIDASAPALTVDAPALTSDTTPTIVGTTDAEDGSTVTLLITDSDGNEQTVTATVENGTYSVDAETPLSEGEYSVEATVTDPAGNTATSNDVGEIDASAPALTVDAPALTSDTTPTIVGTTDAEDGSTVTLVITDSNGNEQTVTATVENGTYSVDAETPLSEGEYSVEATVTDPAGNTATSNDVGEIDLSAPALIVDAPALTSDITPTIVGTTDAEDGSTVTLVITDSDGNEQTVTATVENGTYSVDAETPLSEGEYSVEATVTDPAGNTATSNDVGEIDASAPSLTVDAPALTSDITPTIVGTTDAEDGSTVTLVITDSDGNEQTVTATVENGTYSVDAETPLSEGEYSVEATVTDPAGNTATSNDVGEIDASAPSLTVDAPALTSDTTPTIVGTTDAEDGSTVTLVITDSEGNEQTVTATVENGTYSVDAETPLSEGEYSVEATVTDPAGNTATSNDVGEIDASAPSLTVDAPALTSDTTPTIVGTTDAEDGSTVTLVITDSEGNEQTVTATVENGTYSVDAETPLSEGEYSVEATVTDPAGNTATSNDVGTLVGSDSGAVTEDGVTEASGTLVDVESTDVVAGSQSDDYGTFSVNESGEWTYTLDNEAAAVQGLDAGDTVSQSFVVELTDGTTTTVDIVITGVDDSAPTITDISATSDNSVTEATGDTVTGSFTVAAEAGIDTVTIGGIDITDASTTPVEITTDEGTLTVTGYDAGTGEVSYSYVEDGESEVHPDAGITDSFTVVVTDITGQSTSDSLDIAILDTAPEAKADTRNIGEDTTTALDGNVIDGANDTADTLGADATSVTSVTPAGGSASDVTADDATVVTGSYGTLTLEADGSYSYVLDTTNPAVQSLDADQSLTDVFTYTITDADGDTSSTTLTITVDGSTDGVPTITDISATADNSVTEATGDTVTGSFTVAATAGIAAVTIGGVDISDASTTPVEITTDEGTLTVTGYDAGTGEVTYSYVEDGESEVHPDAGITDSFAVVVTDITGQSSTDSLDIAILDTAPEAKADTRNIGEDTTTALDGNVINGASDTADTLGADATTVTAVDGNAVTADAAAVVTGDYGTLTLEADGSYSYVLDTTNAEVQSLDANQSLADVFSYTITDADGDTSSTTLTITVDGATDGAPTITDISGTADNSVTEATGDTVTGSFTVAATAGIAAVTIGGIDISDASTTPVEITTDEGTLSVTGYDADTGTVTYSYVEDGETENHSGGDITDSFTVVVTDITGQSTSDSLDIAILDTAPTANDDARNIGEDTTTALDGNVIDGASDTADTLGADATTVTGVDGNAVTADDAAVVEGTYGTLTLNSDGSYSYVLDTTSPAVQSLNDGETKEDTFTYVITDADGDSDTATLTITVEGSTDGVPTITSLDDQSVTEATGGTVTDTFKVEADAGIASVTVNGTDITGATEADPVEITTDEGTLSVTGYDADTGTVTYSYVEDGETENHSGGDITDSFTVVVTDITGQSTSDSLDIAILDTAPTANDDARNIGEDTTTALDGNVINGDNDTADTLGADATTVTGVDGNAVTADDAAVVEGTYGTLTLNSDGSYSYMLDTTSPAVQSLNDGETKEDTFTYVITDADGDSDTATLTITVEGSTDGVPTITSLDDQSVTEATGGTVTDTFKVEADAGIASVTVNGTDITGATEADPVEITTDEGTLSVTGYDADTGTVTYSYVEDGASEDHTGGDITDSFSVVVTDITGQSTSDSLDIAILDTAPEAKADARNIDEDTTTALDGNVVDGTNDTADTLGADATSVTSVTPDGGSASAVTADDATVVTGSYGTLTLNSDGSYSYVLDNSNAEVQGLDDGASLTDVFSYTITDADGDASSTTLTITVDGSTDGVPTITSLDDQSVTEATGGTVTDTFQVEADAGIASVTVNGTDITGATETDPVEITTVEGVLSVTGYDADTGTVTYSYVEDGASEDHTGGDITDSFSVVVTDITGQSTSDSLDIAILDTAPEAKADARNIDEDTTTALDGNVIDGTNDTADTLGADATSVTSVTPDGGSASAVTADDATVVTGSYGTLTLNSDGSYSYVLDNSNAEVQGLDDGASLTDVFSYTITDADGDASSTTLTITVDGSADGVPTITSLDDQSVTEATGGTVTDTFQVEADAGIASVTVNGTDITGATETDPVEITTVEGVLSVTGYDADTGTVTYSYVEDGASEDHTGGDITDSFSVVVTDITGQSTSDSLDIAILDTAPEAKADARNIDEDTTTALDGNVIDGTNDTADTLGADATSVTSVTPDGGSASAVTADDATVVTGSYGTLTLNSDGSYSYVLDNSNAEVQGLDDGASLTDVFSYTITDADGDASSTTLTITVDGSTDGVPTITSLDDQSVTEATGGTVTDTFQVEADAGIASVTVNGTDITGATETDPVEITTVEGVLSVTGYDADTGTVTYSYVEDGASEDHTGGDITDSFSVVVTDITGQSTSDSLDIAILDTAPEAKADARNIDEDTTTALDGNVIDGTNDTADTLGADATSVTSVTPDGGSASAVTADDATVVTGSYGTLTLNSDGSYSYVLDNSNAEVQGLDDGASLTDVFSYTITDADGDASSTTLTITVDGSADGVPTITSLDDQSVTEATGGTVTDTFQVEADAGIASVTVNGTDITGATETDPVEITTVEGVLSVTGYDADTGTVTYSYVEDGASEDHTGGDITDSFSVVVTDITGQSTSDSLDIAILDTAPEAKADARNIDEDTTTALDGNVIDGTNDTADTLGADATSVTSVTPDGGSASAVTADDATVVTGSYGTLTLNSDGSYSYVLDNSNAEVQGLDDGASLTDVFSYTITDADGDASSTTLTITVDGSTDGVPTITSLDDQSVTEATGGTVTDTFQVEADAGIASVTVNGTDITGATEADPVEITTDEGTLSVTGYDADTGTVTYSYVEDGASEDHTGGDITDSFSVVVTDITGQSTSDSLDIAILDTAPEAKADARNIDEDTTTALDGNVIDGTNDTADTLGADATSVTSVTPDGGSASAVTADDATVVTGSYGTLTLNSDGSYSYVLDNSNAEVQGLDDGASLTDVFSYTITDADGDASSTTLTITVDGSTDGVPTITSLDDQSVTEATGGTVTDTFQVEADAGIASVTVNGTDITGATEADPIEITTVEGVLSVTGYDADTGTVTYSYVEDGASEDHTGGDITDSFSVVVTDITGQSTSDSLDIAILDTAPEAKADARNIDEDTTTALDGNVIDGTNDTADTLGADATSVTSVTPDGGSASAVTADDATVVTGSYGTLTLNSDGSYSYVLDNSNAEVQGLDDGASLTDVFSYTITDADGDASSTTLTITVDGSTDGVPTITSLDDQSVTEATGGTVTDTFQVEADAGIASVTVNGTDITGATETDPVEITTVEGVLSVTGYDADTGTVTYSYVEDGASEDHTGGDITDSFSVVVTDITGQSTSDSLDIAILDTAPEAKADARNIDEDTTTALDGNVIDGTNDTADTLGADATSVTSVTPDGGSASAVTADDATVVTGSYGTLTLNSDGSYSYVLDNSNAEVQGLDDGASLTDVFSYTITDADGDASSTTLTITVDGSTDGVPTITSLDDQSVTEATGGTVTDTFQVEADAGIASVTVNGTDITGATETDPVEITTVEGVLSVTGYDADTGTVTYSYVEDGASEDHTGGDITDSFSVVVTDITGQSTSDSLDIAILDTAPEAKADARNIDEDTTTALDGNVIDGTNDTADTLGADATSVTSVTPDGGSASAVTADDATVVTGSYGTLTLNSDGSYSYVLDNSNAEVQGLDDGASLTDVFSYTITDADGDASSTTLTITVDGSADGVPTITSLDDQSVTEATGGTVTDTFQVEADAGIASVTVNGTDITGATETDPVEITTVEGVLSVTGYDADTGTVTYSYVEDGASEDHTGGDITDSFSVVVTDITGQSTSDSLDIAILDTAPEAKADARNIDEDTTTALDGNVIDGTNDTADTLGADATSVTSVTPDGGSASAVTADDATVVTGSYGTLTLNSDGSYSYVLDNSNAEVQGLDDGASLTDVFSYTITDADGDASSTTLTITVDGSTDGVPTITSLDDQSVTEATGGTVTDTFQVEADAGIASVTVNGTDITGATETDPVEITTVEGVLSVTGYDADTGTVTYSYVEDGASEDHTGGDITDSFSVVVTDITGQSTSDSLDIAILDTAPEAKADARNIDEDTTTALDGNVIDGTNDTADTLGADATSVTSVTPDGGSASAVTADDATVVTGSYGTLTLNSDGSYSYVLDNSNAEVQGLDDGASLTDVFSYTITDADGDASSTTLTITVDGSADGVPTITSLDDQSVTEATGGTVTDTFQVEADAGIASVTVNGTDITGATETDPVEITTVEGVLSVTGYDADTGTVTYSYVEDGASEDHTGGDITDSFSVVVTDITGQSTSDSLDIAILDTAPEAKADARNIDEDTTTALDGNVIDGTNDTADTLGADATSVTSVTPDGGSASAVTADDATVVTGSYGTLTLNSDGSYSYVLDNSNAEVQGLDDGASLTDVFSYTITDADGDASSTTLTITVDGSADGVPTITSLDDQSVTEATGGTVTDTFQVEADAGIASVTVNGTDITGATETDPVEITTVEGVLSVTGYDADTGTVTYSYVEDGASEDHTGGDITDSFSVVVTDITGQSTSDSLDIAILDTAPEAKADARNIDEDTTTALDGNVIDGTNDTADTLGADATSVTSVTPDGGSASAVTADDATVVTGSYGTLTLNSDGSYSYVLDNSNAEVQGLDDGASLTDVFSYTITDADGDASSTTLTITVDGSTDAVPIITLADKEVTEATGATVTDTFQVEADAGIASVTINGTDITSASVDNPIVIPGATDDEGTLTITGYDSGTVSYTYVEDGTAADHTAGDNSVFDNFAVVVTDLAGQSTSDSLDVKILDTAPVANPDERTIEEDATDELTGNVIDGINDTADTLGADTPFMVCKLDDKGIADGGSATVTGDYGTLTLNSDGSYTYVLDTTKTQSLADGVQAEDVFTYVLEDSDGDTSTTTLTINITGSDDLPVLTADTGAVSEDDVLSATGALTATDVDGIAPTFVAATDDSSIYGSFEVAADGSWTYTLDNDSADVQGLIEGQTVTEQYIVSLSDGTSTTVDIIITGADDGEPTIDSLEDQSVIEGEGATVTDTFNVQADTGIATVTINGTDITGATADNPVAIPGSDGDEGTLTVTGYDADTGTVSYRYVEDGTAADHSGGDDSVVDSFTVVVTDVTGATATDSLDVTVLDTAPVANDDTYTIREDDTSPDGEPVISTNVITSVLGRGQDELGADAVTITKLDGILLADNGGSVTVDGSYGSLTLNTDGSFSYDLDDVRAQALGAGDLVKEEFEYTILDADGDSDTAVITINVQGLNDKPVAYDDGPILVEEDTPVSGNVLSNDVDADGDELSVVSFTVDGDTYDPGETADLGEVGTLLINADGTFTFTPGENYNGPVPDTTYVITDGTEFDEAILSFQDVTAVDDPVVISADDGAVAEDGVTQASGTLTATDVDSVAPTFVAATDDSSDYGSFTVNAEGSWTYTLDNDTAAVQGLTSEDEIVEQYTVTLSDGSTTTVDIVITGTDDALPVINSLEDQSVTEATGSTVTDTFTVKAAAGIAAVTIAGVDITDANTSPVVISNPDGEGTLTVTGYDADTGVVSYSYVEDGTAADHSGGDDSVVDDFAVVVTDLAGQSTTSSLDVTVLDTAPIANADTRSMNENRSAAVTGNVVDGSSATADTLGADAVTVTAVTSGSETVAVSDGAAAVITGAHGELTLEADGSYSYQSAREDLQFLAAGESVTDVYTYVIRDADGDTSSTTLTITINGRNDGPAISVNSGDSASASLTETDSALSTSGTLSVTDVDLSNSVTPSVTSVSSNGDTGALDNDDLLALLGVDTGAIIDDENTEGTLNWTFDSSAAGESFDYLSAGESLVLTYTVTVTDTAGATATQDVTITIQGTNDAPVVTATEGRVSEEGLEGGIADSDAADGFTDTTDATIVTGTVSVTDVDSDSVSLVLTAPATAITSGGSAVTWSGSGTQSMVATDAEGNEVATVTIDDSGAYTFTLSQAVDHSGDGEDVLSLDFGVLATDSEGASSTGTLTIGIEDDAPEQQEAQSFSSTLVDTNLTIILDVSGSMNTTDGIDGETRLQSAIDSIKSLIEAYDDFGDVRINLVTFSTIGTAQDAWMTVGEVETILDSLVANGVTNYDSALAAAIENYSQDGALEDAQSISYFFSDGEPNYGDGDSRELNVLTGGFVYSADAGISNDEEDIWTDFLVDNGIKSYAIGLGSNVTESNLDPIAYDGSADEDLDSTVVTSFEDLDDTLAATVQSPVSGQLVSGSSVDGSLLGADGGYLQSVTVDGTTYSYDPDTNAVSATGTDNSSYDADSLELTISTDLGGSMLFNLGTGDFSYTPPDNVSERSTDSFDYVTVDNDGDSNTSSVSIDVDKLAVVIGTSGNDTLTGDGDGPFYADYLIGQGGDDILSGGVGSDRLEGGSGNDTLRGGTGNDILSGGEGDDLLVGGSGNDILTGGDGADTFQWMSGDDVNSEGGMATDTITDFSVADGDVIDLSDLLQSNGDADALSSFLHFESDGDGGTTIEISVDGSAGSNVTQEITLQDVDLTSGGDSDAQIIQSLLDSNSLKTNTNVDG
ncbi:VCBS domain-containing protein [Cobetia marina]|uniref:VCBS domain-containing protein n=3 Tax=Cobetia TaxID=204286 RepID=UPI001C2F74ED